MSKAENLRIFSIEAADTVSICVIGDIMMHSPQFRFDAESFFEYVAEPMKKADVALANMEFTLAGEPYSGYPQFSAPEKCAEKFCSALGLDIMLTANNHILDRDCDGLERTLDIYDSIQEKLGTVFIGSARTVDEYNKNYPLIIKRCGITFAFVNVTYGTNAAGSKLWPRTFTINRKEIAEAICSAKEQGADIIVALPHWGNEYELSHSKAQREIAEFFIAKGVDAVIGSHPHVIQDIEYICDKPVFYSLGNAVSNMRREYTQLGMMVTLKIRRNLLNGQLRLLRPEIRYTWCALAGEISKGHCVVFADEWAAKPEKWLKRASYIKMMETLKKVKDYIQPVN
ncbi:MAG: CapA family protein [Alistipes sp.]|nr:CapA family protein [Candidatus Alistipes equi]